MKIRTVFTEKYILNTVNDTVSYEEIAEYITENIEDWSNHNVIWDLNEFDFENFKTPQVDRAIALTSGVSKFRKGQKTALVVTSDVGYGMARMFALMGEQDYQFKIEVFRTIKDAEKWFNTLVEDQFPYSSC